MLGQTENIFSHYFTLIIFAPIFNCSVPSLPNMIDVWLNGVCSVKIWGSHCPSDPPDPTATRHGVNGMVFNDEERGMFSIQV